MLALNYKVRHKDIKFPCMVQPKIDGVRAIYRDGQLWSRGGKLFPKINHILDGLRKTDLVLDGELFSYDMTFQEIVGAIKKNNVITHKLIYIVYDVVDLKLPYLQRLDLLEGLKTTDSIKIIETKICNHPEDIKRYHDNYVASGYEGLIIRNMSGLYTLKHRSKDLQKLKEFEDDEFIIVDALSGVGKEEGLVIWVVQTKSGEFFNVRPRGDYETRKKMYKNKNAFIGKALTVRYFGLSDNGIPRFPVGIAIRNYE